MGSTISAIIRIRNLTDSDVTSILVYDADSFDFGFSRPDKIFNGTSIAANSCLERTIDYSTMSTSCPFTMKMVFRNGLEDIFRINYKSVYDNRDPNFRHLTRSHRIHFKKTGPRVLEIIIENTEGQLENRKAEQLIETGCKLIKLGRYSKASVKFMEASQKANKSETILAIENHSHRLRVIKQNADADKKAKTLNNEGLQFLQDVKFVDALKKFDEALHLAQNSDTINLIEDNLRIAREAKLNQDAKELYQQGLILRRGDHNQLAIKKFDEALKIALESSLIHSIKANKAELLDKEGQEILRKAWFLEMTSTEEAIYKFSKARFIFQQAESLKPNLNFQESIDIIDLKIEGEKHFNMGLQLENDGSRLIDQTLKTQNSEDCRVTKDKYEQAWKHYKEAQKMFEEGKKRGEINFQRSLELTSVALNGIERILSELGKAELELSLNIRQ